MKMSREELLARMSQLDSLKELSNEVLHIDRVEQTADDLPDLLQAEVVPMATLKAQKDAPVDEITYLVARGGRGELRLGGLLARLRRAQGCHSHNRLRDAPS
jgi:hypothetical protein